MKFIFLLVVAFLLMGCGASPVKNIVSSTEVPSGYGLIAVNFESNWEYPNEGYLGKPFSLDLTKKDKKGIYYGSDVSLLYTKPDTFKLVALPPGEYQLGFWIIDKSLIPSPHIYIKVESGKVNNMGVLYAETYGTYDVKVTQSDFESTKSNIENVIGNGFEIFKTRINY
ncbi:hypothetical protein ACJJIQ_24675 [Microbulbifer sp. ANSA003]|uniref:hypothetical protein n=1 Tax=Microbulbifer sp. ANSA003 TaxID=3243360 RepID=UPI00404174AF